MKLNLLVIAACLAVPSWAFGQSNVAETASKARIRLGPLRINPGIALTNAGVDENVFNTGDQPQSDFTMTVTPKADAWLRVGRAWVTGTFAEDLVYFHKFASERTANTAFKGSIFVPFNRLAVTVGAGYRSARDRPGYEIDTRSQHTDQDVNGKVEYRLFGKTFIGATGSRTTVDFERGAEFRGGDLQRQLNRTMTAGGVAVRHQMTPITALTFEVERQHDVFEFSPSRDSNSSRAAAGISFDPNGIIAGSASFGYRRFEAVDTLTPGYSGTTARGDLTYRAVAGTKLGLQLVHDVQYSYQIDQPYYLQTGVSASVTQRVGGPFDVVGRVGAFRLAYRGVIGSPSALADRVDAVHTFGGGIGYRFGGGTRFGFNIDKQQRTSDAAGWTYDGLRYGTAVTYGF